MVRKKNMKNLGNFFLGYLSGVFLIGVGILLPKYFVTGIVLTCESASLKVINCVKTESFMRGKMIEKSSLKGIQAAKVVTIRAPLTQENGAKTIVPFYRVMVMMPTPQSSQAFGFDQTNLSSAEAIAEQINQLIQNPKEGSMTIDQTFTQNITWVVSWLATYSGGLIVLITTWKVFTKIVFKKVSDAKITDGQL